MADKSFTKNVFTCIGSYETKRKKIKKSYIRIIKQIM